MGTGEKNLVLQVRGSINGCDTQSIPVGIDANSRLRSFCVLPRQAPFATTNFQDAFVFEICKCMQKFCFVAFGVFLKGHPCFFITFSDSVISSFSTPISTSLNLLIYKQDFPVEYFPSLFINP